MGLSRGFAGEAEKLAEETRAEMGLTVFSRLHPLRLANHLEIPVCSLSKLQELTESERERAAISFLGKSDCLTLSAMTVFRGASRLVVYNDAHTLGRRANSICHELAHGLLLHEATPALDELGCRDWDQDVEDEADYLAAALLLPGKAARGALTLGKSYEQVANEYGCSVQLAKWRMNTSVQRTRRAAPAR